MSSTQVVGGIGGYVQQVQSVYAGVTRPRAMDRVRCGYAKRPFAGPGAVLAYLSRYTHRVAIANSRLIALDEQGITFTWIDRPAAGGKHLTTLNITCRSRPAIRTHTSSQNV